MTLVILAAGMGSRFGGMKQITPVGPSGEFIIDYSCYDAIKAGFDKIVFVIKRENLDIFRETVGHRAFHSYGRIYQFCFSGYDRYPRALVRPRRKSKALGYGSRAPRGKKLRQR